MTDTVHLEVLDVAPAEARIRVQVARAHPGANLPLDASFFVRMLSELADELGGNGAIDAALAGRRFDDAYVDTHAWRWIVGYDETLDERGEQGTYDVKVGDPAWLEGLSAGRTLASTAYSSGADVLTEAEAAAIPPLRFGRLLGELGSREASCVAVSSDARLLAVLAEPPGGLHVYDTRTWERITHVPEPDSRALEVRFVPGTAQLVLDHGEVAYDALSGVVRARAEVASEFASAPGWDALWRSASASGELRVVVGARGMALTDAGGRVQRTFELFDEPVLSADGRRLVAHAGSELLVWDVASEGPPRHLAIRDYVGGLAVSPDGQHVLTVEAKFRHIYARRTSDGARRRFGRPFQDRRGAVPHLPAWSPDGRFVALCFHAPGKPAWVEVYERS